MASAVELCLAIKRPSTESPVPPLPPKKKKKKERKEQRK
jgi:hypothetical protein